MVEKCKKVPVAIAVQQFIIRFDRYKFSLFRYFLDSRTSPIAPRSRIVLVVLQAYIIHNNNVIPTYAYNQVPFALHSSLSCIFRPTIPQGHRGVLCNIIYYTMCAAGVTIYYLIIYNTLIPMIYVCVGNDFSFLFLFVPNRGASRIKVNVSEMICVPDTPIK